MMMTAQEARDKVEAGRLCELMNLIEEAVKMAVADLKDLTQVAVTGEYRSCVTQAMSWLNGLGYVTAEYLHNGN